MAKRNNLRLNVLGTIWLLIGCYFSFNAVSLLSTSADELWKPWGIAAEQTLRGLDAFDEEQVQLKLKAAGKQEEFSILRMAFEHEYRSRLKDFERSLKSEHIFIVTVDLVFALVTIFAGILFFRHHRLAGPFSVLSVWGTVLTYILIQYTLYPAYVLMQKMAMSGHILNRMVDPAYTDMAEYAGRSPLMTQLFGFPQVLIHGAVFLAAAGTTIFLRRVTRQDLQQ